MERLNPTDAEALAQMFPNMSESTRRRNSDDQSPESSAEEWNKKMRLAIPKPPKPRMNKLELRFYEVLLNRFKLAQITPQFRLRVSAWNAASAVFYTPDFLVSDHHPLLGVGTVWRHTAFEVKDRRRRYHSNELRGPKLCTLMNPWICQVILAEWDGESWTEMQIA